MTESEILDLNRKLVEAEIGAQTAHEKGDTYTWLKMAWRAIDLRKQLELYVG